MSDEAREFLEERAKHKDEMAQLRAKTAELKAETKRIDEETERAKKARLEAVLAWKAERMKRVGKGKAPLTHKQKTNNEPYKHAHEPKHIPRPDATRKGVGELSAPSRPSRHPPHLMMKKE